LTDEDRDKLQRTTHSGTIDVRVMLRSQILLALDKKVSEESIMAVLQISRSTIGRTRKAYLTSGLQTSINDNPRPGQPIKYGDDDKAKLTSLACSTPPDGFSRWTVRLLAKEFCQLTGKQISRDTVRLTLKKIVLNPGVTGCGVSEI
jgi:transposase